MKDQTTPRPLQVGDRVRYTYDSELATVTGSKWASEGCYEVKFDNGRYDYIRECDLEPTNEPYDRKRDFLERLKNLLAEFDASIVGGQDEYSHYDFVKISFNNENREIIYQNGDVATFASINPDNIMDYEKK